MIRQHEHHRGAAVTVALDIRPDDHDGASFERSVEAAASVAFSFAGMRRNLRLVLSTGEGLHGSLDTILDQLAVIEPAGPDRRIAALAQRRERALLVLVVATVDDALASWIPQLRRDGPVVIVTTAPPRADAAAPAVACPVIEYVDAPLSTAWNLAWNTQWLVASPSGSPALR